MRHGVVLGILLAATGCKQIFGLEAPTEADAHAGCGWKSVAAGLGHSCAIDAQGRVWCWGGNWRGQAAPGAPDPAFDAVFVALPMPAREVIAGKVSTCARLEDNRVFCWGDNTRGQLGVDDINAAGPVEVPLGEPVDELDVGAFHACARRSRDGTIVCWGDNLYEQLGAAAPAMSATPIAVPNTLGSSHLALGHRHTCSINAGELVCWGRNQRNQLGVAVGTMTSTPTTVPGLIGLGGAAAAGGHSCALYAANGEVKCWGLGENGQLGTGYASSTGPDQTAFTGAVDVQVGNFSTCARTAAGTISCWGSTSLGDGTWAAPAEPQMLPLTGVTAFAKGSYHQCAIAGGELYCWGGNGSGELGRGDRSLFPQPAPIVALPASASSVAVGQFYACAVAANGKAYCWGSNSFGQLGDGTTEYRYAPVEIATGLNGVAGIAPGELHTCAWAPGGAARCWGANSRGQLGTGTAGERQLLPTAVAGTSNFSALSVGVEHTCGIAGSAVKCWGANYNGQLGNNTVTDSSTPVTTSLPSGGAQTPLAISSGWTHSCAVLGTGLLYCWGDNTWGQLGDGTTTARMMPVAVGVPNPIAVSAGRVNTCALTSSGDVYCWGRNHGGALGTGEASTFRTTPTKVTLPKPATSVSTGTDGACVVLADSSTYCWGWGWNGELGTGMLEEVHTPVVVPSITGATSLSRGEGGACAIVNGAIDCWGESKVVANGDSSDNVAMPPNLACPR